MERWITDPLNDTFHFSGSSQRYASRRDSDLLKEMSLLIRSRYGLIHLATDEDERVEVLLKHLADSMNLPLFFWIPSAGLSRSGLPNSIAKTEDPGKALHHVEVSRLAAIYCMEGLAPFLRDDALLEARLLRVVRQFSQKDGALVLTGGDLSLPEAVKPYAAPMRLPAPERKDYSDLIKHIYRDVSAQMPVRVELGKDDMNRLLNNLRGLTLLEADKLLTKAIIEDGKLDVGDIEQVVLAKRAIVERDGLLEYFPVEENLTDVADLATLKSWLEKRKRFITDPEAAARYGLVFPKGILLLGVPGSGKSLCAKAVAMEWALPLLRMDPSNLYNKYIGESEKNFKRAMEAAEKMSPVVLWIDEIEKAFATSGSEDGGVSRRVLGIFLSWMQDRKGDVFVVATANDVNRLPPEFLRKGRFDEIFFLDLPVPEVRRRIFEIHLRKRGFKTKAFDLDGLAQLADGFSGAEIEQVVVAGAYTAFADGSPLTTELLLREAASTQPLSRTRAEEMDALRRWARERTVSAH